MQYQLPHIPPLLCCKQRKWAGGETATSFTSWDALFAEWEEVKIGVSTFSPDEITPMLWEQQVASIQPQEELQMHASFFHIERGSIKVVVVEIQHCQGDARILAEGSFSFSLIETESIKRKLLVFFCTQFFFFFSSSLKREGEQICSIFLVIW